MDYHKVKGSCSLKGLSRRFINGHRGLEDVGTVSDLGQQAPATVEAEMHRSACH